MKKYIAIIIGTLFLLSLSFFAPSQPPFTPPNPYVNGNGQGISGGGLHNVPIDGGLGILLILAAGFGIRKVCTVGKKQVPK